MERIMKIYLILGFALAAMTATASAQSFTAPVGGRRMPASRPAPPISSRAVSGVVPRAIRGGNPLQMLNPRAPARYGTAQESVSFDPHNPGKWKGIKLFTFLF
jgi:hypothetical protein